MIDKIIENDRQFDMVVIIVTVSLMLLFCWEVAWGLRKVTWDLREVIWGLREVSVCPSGLNQGLRLLTMSLREVASGLKRAKGGLMGP